MEFKDFEPKDGSSVSGYMIKVGLAIFFAIVVLSSVGYVVGLTLQSNVDDDSQYKVK